MGDVYILLPCNNPNDMSNQSNLGIFLCIIKYVLLLNYLLLKMMMRLIMNMDKKMF